MRTNTAIAAYRMRRCGWTLEQAIQELEQFGFDRHADRELYDHLAAYWRDHVLTTRPATE
jgi:hypothetical protein